jgi:hypothetical protein
MPKVIWKDYLANPTEARRHLKENTERVLQRAIRERARQCMDDLIDIMEGMRRTSKKVRGREYEHVFKDDKRYFRLLEALGVGYKESIRSMLERVSLNLTVKDLEEIQLTCLVMGMNPSPSLQQLGERHCRRKIGQMLKEKLQDPQQRFSYLDALCVKVFKRRWESGKSTQRKELDLGFSDTEGKHITT